MQKLIIFFIIFFTKFSESSTLIDFRLTPETKTIFKLEEVLSEKLHYPWGMTFIDKHNLLITEKSGELFKFNVLTKQLVNIEHSINVVKYKNKNFAHKQGGLLDVLEHNGELFFSYSHGETFKLSGTAIAKGKLKDNQIIDLKVLLVAKPKSSINKHWGSRILIKNDKLYAGFGERDLGMIAQDPSKHPGSVIRINLDGSIPADNPVFSNRSTWLPEVFQIGVRNPQGISLSPDDGEIYLSQHGPRGGDNISKVKYAGNLGWKLTGWGGTEYSGIKISKLPFDERFDIPLITWVPSIGIGSIDFYSGKKFPEWNGDLIYSATKEEILGRIKFDGNKIKKDELILQGDIGRIRDFEIHESGEIYIVTDKKNSSLWKLSR